MAGKADEAPSHSILAQAAVDSWKSAYAISVQETECKDAGCSTFVAICSKPTQARPVPSYIANVHIRIDGTGEVPTLTYKVENQSHWYTEKEHFPAMVDALLDTVIAQKQSVASIMDVKTPFDRSRLPVVYADER